MVKNIGLLIILNLILIITLIKYYSILFKNLIINKVIK
uniref:Uncharacterized protein n=1 Tax=Moumouvirus sp. 'Monve' TaxID=1128131 RepID=H2EFH5_9VIRU|nr:hypothetical protein mv_L1038 [Moumouvirus Monve]